jgi:hypothetical protein
MAYGYDSVIRCGWKTGVYDVRPHRYQHPWLAVCQEQGAAVGCWSREEARRVLAQLRRGVPAEAVGQ